MQASTTRPERAALHGFTAVEVAVASVLFVVIVVLTYSATTTVTRYTQHSDAEFREETAYRHTLDQLRSELRQSTTERDPLTNLPRYQILTDANGRKSLSFQKLVGARTVNDELSPIWSSTITISYDEKGNVYRTQDGRSIVIGGGVKSMDFVKTPDGKFGVLLTTGWRDPRTNQPVDVLHDIYVKPLN